MSEQSTPGTLPTIFQMIGLAFCGFCSFMGMSYLTDGNLIISIVSTLALMAALMAIVHFLSYWKAKKQPISNDMSPKVPERVLGSIYFLLFLLAMVINCHYLFIDFSRKNQIKDIARNKVDNLINLKKEYQNAIDKKVNDFTTDADLSKSNYFNAVSLQKMIYAAELNEKLGTGTIDFKASKADFEDQYNKALQNKVDGIRNRFNLDSMNSATDAYARKARSIFENWNFLTVGYYYRDVDQFRDKYIAAAKAKMNDFQYPESSAIAVSLTQPFQFLTQSGVGVLLLFFVLIIVSHILILAPYIATKRQAKFLVQNTSGYSNENSLTNYINQSNQ